MICNKPKQKLFVDTGWCASEGPLRGPDGVPTKIGLLQMISEPGWCASESPPRGPDGVPTVCQQRLDCYK